MIAFDSSDGATLRALKPSPSAVLALWFAALNEGQDPWAAWAVMQLEGQPPDAEIAALRFLHAASTGDHRAARQLWTILASFPIDGADSRIILAARNLRPALQF
jgi:hypothetical protein